MISADMVKEKQITSFYFGPSGTVFAPKRPAELWVSKFYFQFVVINGEMEGMMR